WASPTRSPAARSRPRATSRATPTRVDRASARRPRARRRTTSPASRRRPRPRPARSPTSSARP
ncbi:MAG: hypothetical protein AVDCRST_MAG30-851, partial [uncultured Solirubrobacteraceae bacterium]